MSHRLTKPQERVLRKAVVLGHVAAVGGFGTPEARTLTLPDFDRRAIIDRLLRARLLAYGEGFNQYIPTELAATRIRALDDRRMLRKKAA